MRGAVILVIAVFLAAGLAAAQDIDYQGHYGGVRVDIKATSPVIINYSIEQIEPSWEWRLNTELSVVEAHQWYEYSLNITIYDAAGWNVTKRIWFMGYFDSPQAGSGLTWSDSSPPSEEEWTSQNYRNLKFWIQVDIDGTDRSNPTATVTELYDNDGIGINPNTTANVYFYEYNLTTVEIGIRFYLKNVTRYDSVDTWDMPTDVDDYYTVNGYYLGNWSDTDSLTAEEGWNDPGSWNFNITLFYADNPAESDPNNWYKADGEDGTGLIHDEFGVYQFIDFYYTRNLTASTEPTGPFYVYIRGYPGQEPVAYANATGPYATTLPSTNVGLYMRYFVNGPHAVYVNMSDLRHQNYTWHYKIPASWWNVSRELSGQSIAGWVNILNANGTAYLIYDYHNYEIPDSNDYRELGIAYKLDIHLGTPSGTYLGYTGVYVDTTVTTPPETKTF